MKLARGTYQVLTMAIVSLPAMAQPAGAPAKPAGSDDVGSVKLEARLTQMDEIKLCLGLGVAIRDKKIPAAHVGIWERVAKSRKAALEKDFVPAIYQRKPAMQMSECDVLASLGMPSAINTTHYSGGTRRQFVYANPRRYVYLVNSSVASWQE